MYAKGKKCVDIKELAPTQFYFQYRAGEGDEGHDIFIQSLSMLSVTASSCCKNVKTNAFFLSSSAARKI